MFSSLKIRNFRIYWFGMLVSLIGSWIQTVAQSWLMFDLTKSVFMLGLTGFLSYVPVFMLSLLGGVVADRVSKRAVLLFTQNAFMLLALALGVLTQFKVITPPQLMAIALLNGIVMAFDAPARQAIVIELAGREHLLNAVVLNSAAFNSSRLIGPALAGMLIAAIGMSGCFYINAFSFLAVIAALLFIRVNHLAKENENKHFISDLANGLKFVKNNPTILLLISIVGIVSLFGVSYVILMPVFSEEVLKVGVGGLGFLMSASGLGALLAALMLAKLGDIKHKGGFLFWSLALYPCGLIIFAFSKNYAVSLCALLLVGWSSVTAMSLINTSLQELTPDNFRGRVMGVFMFTFAGTMPFGNLIAGFFAQAFGVSLTVAIGGGICALAFIAINILYPAIRRI